MAPTVATSGCVTVPSDMSGSKGQVHDIFSSVSGMLAISSSPNLVMLYGAIR